MSEESGGTAVSLLVLGSKPEPVLPPRGTFDAVACANASGWSAAAHGLPVPRFTVLSSVVVSGKNPSNVVALAALRGLRTGTVYICPRSMFRRRLVKKLRNLHLLARMSPIAVRWQLRRVGYRFDEALTWPIARFVRLIATLSGNDAALMRMIAEKPPSTGMLAVALGLGVYQAERVIVAGFSFEISHAYGENPDIALRGSAASFHAATDIAMLASLARATGKLVTTEPAVAAATGIPLLSAAARQSELAR